MRRLLVFAVFFSALVAGTAAAQIGGTAPIYRSDGYTCAGGASDTSSQVGHFTADRTTNTVKGSVALTGVATNANFAIVVFENHPCRMHNVGTLHTDLHGNGSIHYTIGVFSTATVVWASTSHDHHFLRSTAVAIG